MTKKKNYFLLTFTLNTINCYVFELLFDKTTQEKTQLISHSFIQALISTFSIYDECKNTYLFFLVQ